MIGMPFFGNRDSLGHIQRGYVYETSGAFFVRYNVTEIVDVQPKRVQRSHRLCQKGGKYYARDCRSYALSTFLIISLAHSFLSLLLAAS